MTGMNPQYLLKVVCKRPAVRFEQEPESYEFDTLTTTRPSQASTDICKFVNTMFA